MKCECKHDDGVACHRTPVLTVVYATLGGRRELDACVQHTREIMATCDVLEVDGLTIAELNGTDESPWMADQSIMDRITELKGRAA